MKLEELKNKILYNIAHKIYQLFNEVSMIAFYGSQVSHKPDKFSDYDVLVILRNGRCPIDKSSISELEDKLNIRLHLTLYSEDTYRILLMTELYLKFWLHEAIIIGDSKILESLPKTAKMGFMESLFTAESYLEMANKEIRISNKSKYYMAGLKLLLMIEESLEEKYDFDMVRKKLDKLLGKKLVYSLRIPDSRIKMKELEKIEQLTLNKFDEIEKKVNLLKENESDLYWRKMKARIYTISKRVY